jgi:hypothetical protein
MAEPRALDGMQRDERQELKEAVCDAILERTRRVVSGEGPHGEVILGEKPSRVRLGTLFSHRAQRPTGCGGIGP